jgi:hypothetical protein
MLWARLDGHSHPVASTDGAVGVRGLAGNLLPGPAGERLGLLAGTRGVLGVLSSRGRVAGGLLDRLGVLLVLVDGPVENVVVLEALAHEQVAEDLAQVAVVRLVVEAERARVVQIDGELVGETAAEHVGGGSP